jgi:excisionase family DNA binding protein
MSAIQSQNDTDQVLLTAEDAARLLSISRTKVYGLMATGKLRYKKIGSSTRIPRAELERFASTDLIGGWAMQPHNECCGVSQDVGANDVANTNGHFPAIRK